MNDVLQKTLHTAAASSDVLKALAFFCANGLIVLVGLAFAVLAWLFRERITRQFAARLVLSGVVALLLVRVLGPSIHDPRPYMAEGYAPLAHAASDNGFPSDHTLVVALLTGWAAWFLPVQARGRWLAAFVLSLLLVMLGRLAIGAHHTLDVLGSLVIAALSLGAASLVNLGAGGQRPLLPLRQQS